jgi:hypothetical protein
MGILPTQLYDKHIQIKEDMERIHRLLMKATEEMEKNEKKKRTQKELLTTSLDATNTAIRNEKQESISFLNLCVYFTSLIFIKPYQIMQNRIGTAQVVGRILW